MEQSRLQPLYFFLKSARQVLVRVLTGHSMILMQRQFQMLLRRPSSYWILCAALFVICFSFTAAYNGMAQVTYDIDRMQFIGPALLHYFRQFSLLALCIIVPVIGVHAVSQEREAGTLDIMMTTPVPPVEFALSKIITSMFVVLLAVMGTMPILGLIVLMGGVGPVEVITLFLLELTVALVGLTVGISMGARMNSFIMGLLATYGILALALIPTYGMARFGEPREYPAAMLPGIVIMLVFSYHQIMLIPNFLAREVNTARPKSWRPLRMKGIDTQLWTFLGVRDHGEPINESSNPVYVSERERFLSFVARRDFDAPSVLWLLSVPLAVISFRPVSMMNIALFIALIFVPLIGAYTIAGEHERKSWESLRTTLLSTRHILLGKLRLVFGQGLIHVVAVYCPALMLLGMVWLMVGGVYSSGIGYFQPWNVNIVWGGHALAAVVILLTVLLFSVLSLLVSTFFKKSFNALLFSYGAAAFFLFAPGFLSLIHPKPGTAIGGANENDLFTDILASWNATYAFNHWQSAEKFTKDVTDASTLFWQYYSAHVVILVTAVIACYLWAKVRVARAQVS